MLIIPEKETVVILVPRTGSGSLYRAVLAQYPQAFMPYRHMEACGVPAGYDRWQRCGVVRSPLERLWSLYKFMRGYEVRDSYGFGRSLRQSALLDFDRWILENQVVFNHPYDLENHQNYHPLYHVNHPLPPNRKSQFLHLRPDLGTRIWGFEYLHEFFASLGLDKVGMENVTQDSLVPAISTEAQQYVEKVFAWDYEVTE